MIDRPVRPRAQTMRFQGAANAVVRGLLRTPLLGRVVGRRLVIVYVTGRRTGKRYAVTRWYGLIARDNRQFAAFNKIGYDADGEPNAEDLRLAWRGGARAILLTPR
jgi:hypothetical protein